MCVEVELQECDHGDEEGGHSDQDVRCDTAGTAPPTEVKHPDIVLLLGPRILSVIEIHGTPVN